MSTYLSATQISCPGSLRREERVTHGLATVPGDGRRSLCTGTSTIHLVQLNSAPTWEMHEYGAWFEPRCDVTADTSMQLQERRSEDPSFPGRVNHQ